MNEHPKNNSSLAPLIQMRWLIPGVLIATIILGCYGTGDYRQAENPTAEYIDPKDFRVDPMGYPKYRAIRDFQPPDLLPNPNKERHLVMPKISTNYIWEVRHRVGNRLWIFSQEYHDQKCHLERCYGSFVFEISLMPDGRVEPGWRQIENPNYVGLRGDRIIPANPDTRYDLDWGIEPLFEELKKN